MADYSLDRLPERAAAAKAALHKEIEKADREYAHRRVYRHQRGIVPVALLGMGRAGKDTAGAFLCSHLGLTNPGSSSVVACPYVAHMAGETDLEAFYAARHQNRMFWYHACNALREGDYAFLARMCMAHGDILIGLRDAPELAAAVAAGVVELTVWIANPRVPVDPTVTFTIDDCDLVVRNSGTVEQFHAKLLKLAPLIRRA